MNKVKAPRAPKVSKEEKHTELPTAPEGMTNPFLAGEMGGTTEPKEVKQELIPGTEYVKPVFGVLPTEIGTSAEKPYDDQVAEQPQMVPEADMGSYTLTHGHIPPFEGSMTVEKLIELDEKSKGFGDITDPVNVIPSDEGDHPGLFLSSEPMTLGDLVELVEYTNAIKQIAPEEPLSPLNVTPPLQEGLQIVHFEREENPVLITSKTTSDTIVNPKHLPLTTEDLMNVAMMTPKGIQIMDDAEKIGTGYGMKVKVDAAEAASNVITMDDPRSIEDITPDRESLIAAGLRPDYGPKHPDWIMPSKRNRYKNAQYLTVKAHYDLVVTRRLNK